MTALAAIMLGGTSGAIAQTGPGMMEREPGSTPGQAMQPRGGPMMGMGQKGHGMGYGMGHAMGGKGMHGPDMMGMSDPTMLHDISPEQRQEMRSIQRETRRANMETALEMMDVHDEMADAMAEDRPDPEQVRKLHDRMAGLHGDMMQRHVETRNRLHDVLTDAQRERLRATTRGN